MSATFDYSPPVGPHRRLMAAVVAQALCDANGRGTATDAERDDARRFLARPERCGDCLARLDVDAEAFCEPYRLQLLEQRRSLEVTGGELCAGSST